jgi:hypothetical protein
VGAGIALDALAGGITGDRTSNTVAARPTTASTAARIARQRKIAAFMPASNFGRTRFGTPYT